MTASPLHGRRVVVVLRWSVLGGSERQALLLARHLAEAEGADVEVCALTGEDGRAVDLAHELGIPWRPVPLSWDGSRTAKAVSLARLTGHLRKSHAHVVLPYCGVPNVLCGLVWRFAGASLCVWHQRDVSPPRRIREGLQRRALHNTPLIVANAQHAADFLVSTLDAPRDRIRVVPPAVELSAPVTSRGEWRARLELSGGDFAVCMLAHLHRFKDHDTLLRAWRIVVDELRLGGREAVLLLAGRASGTEDELKALAYDLELGRSVRFLGEVDDIAGLIGACDAGAFSSIREGCPNGVLECMAGGLVVAGTDIPGIREAVGPDGYAFLAPPGDADGLAAAVIRLARDPALREEIGRRSSSRVHAEFAPERVLARHTSLLAGSFPAAGRSGR